MKSLIHQFLAIFFILAGALTLPSHGQANTQEAESSAPAASQSDSQRYQGLH